MICVAWVGMGSYAQCALTQFIKDCDEEVTLIAITSDVPKICKTELAGAKVIWVEKNDTRPIDLVVGKTPRVLVEGGWFLPILRRYVTEVRQGGGHVIGMLDNPMMSGWRLFAWTVYFHLKYRRWYEGFIAAGEDTRKLLRFARFPAERIAVGSYPCDLSIFTNGGPLAKRAKKIVYVGRFIGVKNIDRFLNAFIRFGKSHPEWSLDLYGQGPLQKAIEVKIASSGLRTIVLHPFATPQELSVMYKQVRVLALPSYSDHWGVVVQEAAASGCAEIVSTGVRAADQFCNEKNAVIVDPISEDQMVAALEKLASWTDAQWAAAQEESVKLAQTLTPQTFSDGLRRLIDML